jgi:hypothetical protein
MFPKPSLSGRASVSRHPPLSSSVRRVPNLAPRKLPLAKSPLGRLESVTITQINGHLPMKRILAVEYHGALALRSDIDFYSQRETLNNYRAASAFIAAQITTMLVPIR